MTRPEHDARTRGILAAVILLVAAVAPLSAQSTRARDLGIPFEGTPGPLNAITDVAGVEVGHVTLIGGSGPLVRGVGPVRTGVTAILPRGKDDFESVSHFHAWVRLAREVGDTLRVRILRGGRPREIELTLVSSRNE